MNSETTSSVSRLAVPVADDDGVDAVLLDEAGELALGAGDVVARLGGIDHAVVE